MLGPRRIVYLSSCFRVLIFINLIEIINPNVYLDIGCCPVCLKRINRKTDWYDF